MILKKEKRMPNLIGESMKEVKTEQQIDRADKTSIQIPLVKHSITIGEMPTSRSSMFVKHNSVEKNVSKDTFSSRFHSIATTHNPSNFFRSERSTLHELYPASNTPNTDFTTARSETQATQKLRKM